MKQENFFSKYFDFQGHKTTLGTEVNAGFTTFMTMAYILVVNPIILADAGMDPGAVFTATALSSMIATLFMAFLLGDKGTRVLVPFTAFYINLGIFYYPFVAVFMTLLVNSTNLTDGVDGLLSTVSFVACFFFLAVTKDLFMPELFRLTLIFLGSLLGYIYYNRFPAKIFMGDTGSMAIGGFIGTMMLLTSTPLFVFFIGFIYVVESLSVVLQVWSFQTKGVRIFKMSPIHHHYELSGYSENKIVLSFAAVTLVGLLLGLLAYRI